MNKLTYGQAFDLMTKNAVEGRYYNVLCLDCIIPNEICFKVATRDVPPVLLTYSEAIQKFKQLLNDLFEYKTVTSLVEFHESSIGVAKNTRRGMVNCVVEDLYALYASTLDNMLFDCPIHVVKVGNKYHVDQLKNGSISASCYGFKIEGLSL